MTTIQDVLEPRKVEGPSSTPLFKAPISSPRAISTAKTTKECRDLAKHLAYNAISGSMEHDKGHPEKAVEGFYQVYLHLFPEIGILRARRAAELFVEACVRQDEIEDHVGHTKTQVVEDPGWDEVQAIFLEQTSILGIPEAYAEHTTNYFRYHGVKDSRYINYCLEADRILTTAVIGNSYWAKILGSLYLICLECHDKHDSTGLEAGLQFASKYFELILREKAAEQQKHLAPSPS